MKKERSAATAKAPVSPKREAVVEVGINPHGGQREVMARGERFRTVIAGRRFGKTHLAATEVLQNGLTKSKQRIWWASPSYKISDEGWDVFHALAGQGAIVSEKPRYPKSVTLASGSRVEFLSTERTPNLRGAGIDFLVIDEARWVKPDAWTALRPALMDKKGHCLIITTPGGVGTIAYRYWVWGQDPAKPDYWSGRFRSVDNPYLDAQEVAEAREDMDEDLARQELDAEWLEGQGIIFRNVRNLATIPPGAKDTPFFSTPPEGRCVAGVDFARLRDFTVVSVFDRRGRQVALDRFQYIDWPEQIARVAGILKTYRARAICDATGLGDPVVQYLQDASRSGGFRVEGYTISPQSKIDLVGKARLITEKAAVQLFAWEPQIAELESYGYELSERGRITYGSQLGHDDMVMAYCLACWGLDDVLRAGLSRLGFSLELGMRDMAAADW